MKHTCLLAVVTVSLAASVASAQEPPLYVGGKIASMDADFAGFDPAINAGVIVGYDVYTHPVGTFSAEGEFMTTLADGDIDGGGEWDADTLALYAAYRSNGNFYGKAKAGFLDQDIKRGGVGGGSIAGDDSGFSFGLGGGWRTGRGSQIEAEYTFASDDLNAISIAYVLHY